MCCCFLTLCFVFVIFEVHLQLVCAICREEPALHFWNSNQVRAYLQRQWKQILSGRVSLQDFVSAKEDKQTMLLLMGNSSSPSLAKIQRKL
ncbi:DNA polymerase zeta catalytic subunit-like isoform X1 [Prunus persica]|uniref:DNA polymerase zeta catalytic subunit-like isoform X1 n=1 Tax=Prunus persica TaxID=3760 RepID=UPI0009AB6082|nr:DNA polymerase zeta catalytic subunit-like isoform X1 [Prunus persica]